jgi:hypothetical protein
MSLRFRFTTGSLLWLTAIAAILLAWRADHARLMRENATIAADRDQQMLKAAQERAQDRVDLAMLQNQLAKMSRADDAE